MTEQEQNQATLTERVKDIIEQIRPSIQADGGDIELVDIDPADGRVSIRFQGACRGCPMAAMTLKMGVERHIKAQVPEVSEVVAVD
ncbi:MAG: NifU family protein [Planctomycetota bacterium]|nr:NifU family protein [Planctomycetota bacterium]